MQNTVQNVEKEQMRRKRPRRHSLPVGTQCLAASCFGPVPCSLLHIYSRCAMEERPPPLRLVYADELGQLKGERAA